MIDVNIPIIYIHDFDFARVDDLIQLAVGSNNKKIYEWNSGTGITDFKTRRPANTQTDLSTFIKNKYLEEPQFGDIIPNKFVILRGIHDLIDDPKIKTLLALFAQRKLYDRNFDSSIIIIDSVRKVPEEIAKYVSYLEIEYPNDEEIEQLIKEHVDENGYYSKLAEARNRKLDIPKGVFIVGMPGCGKSLCAKATAALFKCPLLKLDMGSMMGKYVGESEANLRKAIKIAEAAAPCIVWIDEIEKAFSGISFHGCRIRKVLCM